LSINFLCEDLRGCLLNSLLHGCKVSIILI
jgi:hypothetical protein